MAGRATALLQLPRRGCRPRAVPLQLTLPPPEAAARGGHQRQGPEAGARGGGAAPHSSFLTELLSAGLAGVWRGILAITCLEGAGCGGQGGVW